MPVEGYDKLAAMMGLDQGLAIFRRFANLNAKNLLYLQAEIANLEAELNSMISDDKDPSDPNKAEFPFYLMALKHFDGGGSVTQWDKILEIRGLLKEYNETLLQQSQLMQLNPPNSFDLRILREWLRRQNGGEGLFLSAIESKMWDETNAAELVTLTSRHNGVDTLTKWIYGSLFPWLYTRWGIGFKPKRDEELGATLHSEEAILFTSNIIGIILSAFLPTTSMVILLKLNSIAAKLLVIFVYTVLFSLALALTVKARRIEVFGAATAFAAVQGVFISNSSSNPS